MGGGAGGGSRGSAVEAGGRARRGDGGGSRSEQPRSGQLLCAAARQGAGEGTEGVGPPEDLATAAMAAHPLARFLMAVPHRQPEPRPPGSAQPAPKQRTASGGGAGGGVGRGGGRAVKRVRAAARSLLYRGACAGEDPSAAGSCRRFPTLGLGRRDTLHSAGGEEKELLR